MTIIYCPQVHTQYPGETRVHSVDFQDALDSGVLLTGTPTVVDANLPSPEVLTLGNKAVNATSLTINGRSCAAGQAVQFTLACNTAGSYSILVSCGTDGTPAETIKRGVKVIVRSA